MKLLDPKTLYPIALLLAAAGAMYGCEEDDDEVVVDPCGPPGDPNDLVSTVPRSCAFLCGTTDCTEPEIPYDCPAMHNWAEFPHGPECGCWDGSYPQPVEGECSAGEPTGEALRPAGPQGAGAWVLPDGHIIEPAGIYASLDESELSGTFPMTLLPIPQTSLLLSSDGGIRDNALRLIDATALAAGAEPTAAVVRFARPASLYHGVAFLPPDTALASGGGDGFIYAFTVDNTLQTLSRDEGRDIDLGGPVNGSFGPARWYSGPIALSGDGTRLLVGPSDAAQAIQIRSVEDATWGDSLGSVSVPSSSVFEIARDPFDPAGDTFYATLWDGAQVVELNGATGELTRSLEVCKNPEGMAFLSQELMVVACADEDRLTVIDRQSWQTGASVELLEVAERYGHAPTTLAFDAPRSRLYATLAGVNAVAVLDVSITGTDATLAPIGRIPSAWWPTSVVTQDDGSLIVLAGKGTGTGPDLGEYEWNDGPITSLMHGGVQYVEVPGDLTSLTSTSEAARKLADTPGYPAVSCPGDSYDFPVPRSPEEGPSEQIKHVIFIVRENKTYDAVFGDLPGTNGDADLVMAPGEMDDVWPNARQLAQTFTNFDNFYTDAEQSLQGHIWTVFGRSTDFIERSWLTAWGRGTRPPSTAGITEQGKPAEGSLFNAFDRAGVAYANMGEMIGIGDTGLDPKYPGLVTTISKPDLDKACYLAARARAACDLPALSYMTLPNDHTEGGTASAPHPGVMIAVNDEATGRVVDALSHSPLWQDTLIIVTEDDPQNGADHVEVHRTLLFMASPWVKHGYVSKGHYDMSSVLKLIQTILGVPYLNEQIAQAPLPYDAFTSTPDYTPFTFTPRSYDQPCNPPDTRAAAAARLWENVEDVDEQPGIHHWVWRILRHKTYD